MTSSVTTQRLLLASSDVRVFAGTRDGTPVFVTRVIGGDACAQVQKHLDRRSDANVDVSVSDSAIEMVMPAIAGVRFDALAGSGELAVREAMALTVQATEVVQEQLDETDAATTQVRPWNLWLGQNGSVTHTSYGLPAALLAQLRPGIATWSDAYRTPESLLGQPDGAAGDVFRLGATCLHLITGQPAFDAGDRIATLDGIRRGEVTPPSLQRAEVTVALEDVLLRSVTPEVAGRFASPEEFGRALLEVSVGALGVATRKDLRTLATARRVAAAAWLEAHPAPSGEDDPTLIVVRDDEPTLEWGDDEETHVWGEEAEQEVTEDDVIDPDAPSTVVVDRDAARTTAPPIPAAASGSSPAIESGAHVVSAGSGEHVTAPSKVVPQNVVAVSASVSPTPSAEDNKTTMQTRRPTLTTAPRSTPSNDGAALKWVAMLGVVLFAIAFVTLRPSCNAEEASPVQLALSPTDLDYRVLVDGVEVARGAPPLRLEGLEHGEHALRIEADGYAPVEQTIVVGPSAPTVLQVQLSALAAEAPPTEVVAPTPAVVAVPEGSADSAIETNTALVAADLAQPNPAAEVPPAAQAPEAAIEAPEQRERPAVERDDADADARRAAEAEATAARLRQQQAERDARLAREANSADDPQAAQRAAERDAQRAAEAEQRAAAERATREREAADRAAQEREAAAREAAEAAAAEQPASTEPGFLNVQSVPAAQVFINGQDTGRFTPLINVPLPPGQHRVRLVNSDFGLDRSYTITIESGRPRTVLNRQEQ